MHSEISIVDLVWAFGIPSLQIVVAIRPGMRSLRAFLLSEATISLIQAISAIGLGKSTKSYLYTWIAVTIVHHALCAYLVSNFFSVVRLRGLPSRQSQVPVFIMLVAALALGGYFAFVSNGMISSHDIRIIIPLDYALGLTVGSMAVMLPFYCIAISSSMPRPLQLALFGFSLYEISYLGLIGDFITHRRLDFPHGADFVYLLSLIIWFFALHSKSPAVAEECLSVDL